MAQQHARAWAIALGLAPILALAQGAHAAPQVPTFRASTRLVLINVVVQDHNGPVADLSQNDFTLLDRGHAQTIAVFSLNTSTPAALPAAPLPPNTFTNTSHTGASGSGGLTIILLDALNTLIGPGGGGYSDAPVWTEDLAGSSAKAHLITYIQQLPATQPVALFALDDQLRTLCDFTCNRVQLLAAVSGYAVIPRTQQDMAQPTTVHTPVPDPNFDRTVNAENLDLAAQINQERARQTMAAMEAIAAHVAGLPGRKSLVWLTANLPFSSSALAGILVPAQIAAYPVDARGLMVPRNFHAPPPVGQDTMLRLAKATGGEAFINTNDIAGAIGKAVADSAVSYTLGFYLPDRKADGEFHRLQVKVNRQGMAARYPEGYFAYADAGGPSGLSPLAAAMRSPLAASAVPLQVTVRHSDHPLPHALDVTGTVDLHGVHLKQQGNLRVGAVNVILVEQDANGLVRARSAYRFTLRFDPAQYAQHLQSGLIFEQTVQPKDGVTLLRVLVQDPSNHEVGDVIVPLADVK